MADDWLDRLKRLAQRKPLVLFRFEGEEWSRLREARRRANEFTIARSHDLFEKVRVPTACLVIGKDDDGSEVYFGLASSRSAVTTLESRIEVKRALHIQPSSKAGILKLVTDKAHARNLRDGLPSRESVIALSPGDRAVSLELTRGRDRALARVNIMEDSVVEHDARTFPDYRTD